MTTINLITSPDRIFNDNQKILLIYPTTEIQTEFQTTVLEYIEDDLDLYIFDISKPSSAEIDWLLVAVNMVDKIIVDIDNCDSTIRMLLGYIIAKSKTYWLTNSTDPVYTYISKNRIYNLDNFKTGVNSV